MDEGPGTHSKFPKTVRRIAALLIVLWPGCHRALLAAEEQACPVTTSDHMFVPPPPYKSLTGTRDFLFGSAKLWTVIHPDFRIIDAGKLAFFRQGYDYWKETRPRLTVFARRRDQNSALVENKLTTGGSVPGEGPQGMAMITGVDLPSPGCWEISAHYHAPAPRQYDESLTYVVWIRP